MEDATPLERISTVTMGSDLPSYPAPPSANLQQDDGAGSGTFASEKPTIADRVTHGEAAAAASAAAAIGYEKSSANLMHYLGGSGSDFSMDVEAFLKDNKVNGKYTELLNEQIQEARNVYARGGLSSESVFTIQSRWVDVSPTMYADAKRRVPTGWYIAVGGGSMSISTRFRFIRRNGKVTMTTVSRVDYFDRYNWDKDKSFKIGAFRISDKMLGRLQTVGLARSYDIKGSWKGPSKSVDVSDLVGK